MISMQITKDGETHKLICENLRKRLKASQIEHGVRCKEWRQAEEKMVGYVPESELDAKRRNRRENSGTPEYTTIQLPYTYAVTMAAHSYWSTVFLSRQPVFQFSGTQDEGELQVQALEALMAYNTVKGRMLPNLFIWLQDVGKYGEGWVTNYWRRDRVRVAEFAEIQQKYLGFLPTGRTVRQKIIREIMGYQGNALHNIAPMDVFTDPRYPRGSFQRGEFVAIKIPVSRNELLNGKAQGRYINVDRVAPTGLKDGGGDYETSSYSGNSDLLERPDTGAFGSNHIKSASDVYNCYEFVINLIPKDWKLGSGDLPEKWVFLVTADFQTILEARPFGCLHDRFPLSCLEVEPEGYAKFSRGLIEIFGPVQNTLDWLVNSHFFNIRQVLNNQWLLDPSRIETRDLEGNTPGKAIRLKPAAYGTDIRTALMQLPVQDVTRTHFADMQFMFSMGERLGINDTVMGMTSPSSRRTAQEIRGDQTFSVSRLKTMSEFFSVTGWADLSGMLVSNAQQYYDGAMKLKIAGEFAQMAGPAFIDVTPEQIAGDYAFVPVDGTLPVDRYAQANLWREMIAQMAQVPQVMMRYDLGKIFGYVAQLSGIKNLSRFQVEVVPDARMQAMAASGQSVPVGEGNPLEPGQVPLMGPTA